MSLLNLEETEFISPNPEHIKDALLKGEYIICCSASKQSDTSALVLENVTRLAESIPGIIDAKAIVEYGISNNPHSCKYRLHDSLVVPIISDTFVEDIVQSMLEVFDFFIRDNGHVERSLIYGKLQTECQDEIVYKQM